MMTEYGRVFLKVAILEHDAPVGAFPQTAVGSGLKLWGAVEICGNQASNIQQPSATNHPAITQQSNQLGRPVVPVTGGIGIDEPHRVATGHEENHGGPYFDVAIQHVFLAIQHVETMLFQRCQF